AALPGERGEFPALQPTRQHRWDDRERFHRRANLLQPRPITIQLRLPAIEVDLQLVDFELVTSRPCHFITRESYDRLRDAIVFAERSGKRIDANRQRDRPT